MPPICKLPALAFLAPPHDLLVALASRRRQKPTSSIIWAQARAQPIIPSRPEAGAGGQDVLTAEAAEDAQSAAAVKLYAPLQASPPATAISIAQRTFAIAAASRPTYNGFAPSKEETTLDDAANFATVEYIILCFIDSF